MSTNYNNAYNPGSNKMAKKSWITDPRVEDPKDLPEPLGWAMLIRPYPIDTNKEVSSLIIPDTEFDYLNYVSNIGRVVAMGPCCYTRSEHRVKDADGNLICKDWVKVGDFVTYPKNVGSRRNYKGVSYIVIVDDEITERLPDPQVFTESFYKVDIPQEHLEKYNTIYNKGIK